MSNRTTALRMISVFTVGLGSMVGSLLMVGNTPVFAQEQSLEERHTFTFGEFTWDERNTPEQAVLLGEGGTYGNAQFSEGLPTSVAGGRIHFPDRHQLNANLTVGALAGLGGTGRSALNLPANSDGTTQRHGVELGWSGNRRLPNGEGADLVIYESGTQHLPDGLMVRVRLAGSGAWTPWFYTAPAGFELYRRTRDTGTHVFAVDLSDLGVAANAFIDAIQIANLSPRDRIDQATGTATKGFVKVDDNGATSSIVPNTGYSNYENDHFDPDILYVAALRGVVQD